MKDENKTKKQLITELIELRRRITEFEMLGKESGRAREAVRRQADLLQKTFNSMNDAILVLDASVPPVILECNEAASTIFGYDKDVLLDKTTRFLHVSDESLKGFQSLLCPAVEEGRLPFHFPEFPMKHKDGKIFPSELIVNQLADDKGKRIGWVSLIKDITQRKRSKEEITIKSEAIDTSINAIAFADLNGNLTYVNKSFLKMWGYNDDEGILGKPAVKFWEAEEKAVKVQKALIENGSWIGELTARRKNNSLFDVQLSASMVTDDKGRSICMMGSFVDVTERKQADEALHQIFESTIYTMGKIVEKKDPFTAGHQQRVAHLANAISKEIELSEKQIKGIYTASFVHDIGKIYVSPNILVKPGRLSEAEFDIIKVHPKEGYDTLKGIEFPFPVAQIVLQHHERMDGSGYPSGLSGKEILLEAKVLAVSDVVEAMAHDRPYRPAIGIDRALEEISQNKGILYDPDIVDACLRLFNEKRFKFSDT